MPRQTTITDFKIRRITIEEGDVVDATGMSVPGLVATIDGYRVDASGETYGSRSHTVGLAGQQATRAQTMIAALLAEVRRRERID